jgi:pimeloyl-ACP methyl ester carboxylesterase
MIEVTDSGPVDVIAHSYGALCALGAAGNGAPMRRLVVYEPPLPARAEDYFPHDLIGTMGELITRGDNAAAVAEFLSRVLALKSAEIAAMQRLASWPALVDRAAIVRRELEAVERLSGHPGVFHACWIPTLLMLGGDSPPHYRATAESLHAVLAASRIVTLESQAHAAINAAPAVFAQEAIAFLSEP